MSGWIFVGVPLLLLILLSWWGEDSRPGFSGVDVKERGFVHPADDRRRI